MRWVWWEGLMRTWWWGNNDAWVVADRELSMNVNQRVSRCWGGDLGMGFK